MELFYLRFGVALFALDVLADGVDGERQVYLFPRCHVITSTDVGLVITATIQSAERVSKFGNLDASKQKKKIEKESSCLCNCAWCIRVNKPRLRAEEAALAELQKSWADDALESGLRSEPSLGHSHSHGASSKRLSSNDGGRIRQVELMRTVIDVPKENGGEEPKTCVLQTDKGCEKVRSFPCASFVLIRGWAACPSGPFWSRQKLWVNAALNVGREVPDRCYQRLKGCEQACSLPFPSDLHCMRWAARFS